MPDKENAARLAWATVKLTAMGAHPAPITELAAQAGVTTEEAARLLKLVWRDKIDIRGGLVHLATTPSGPRRYQVHTADWPVGHGKGCSVDTYLLALALGQAVHVETTCPATGAAITVDITPRAVEHVDPPTTVVALLDRDVDLTAGPERTDSDICAHQPFFATPEAASTWLATHPTGRLIPATDFHHEARRLVAQLEGALGDGPGSSRWKP